MIVQIDKSFVKDAEKIKDQRLLNRIAICIDQIIDADSLDRINSVKKMKGETCYYRIRLGDFRVGLRVDGETVFFLRVLHRKEIYKYFP
ncbi:MAG: type II toxin-antitoxin system RelE/ParE family toxin [Bacteroidota bacterium]